jgi:SAM-dependent methyltransferase
VTDGEAAPLGGEAARSACPACGGALRPWRSVAPGEPTRREAVPLLRCSACGTAVTDAPPLPDAHDAGAYGGTPRLSGLAAPLLARFDRARLRLLRLDPPARLLDAGGGRGRFVAAARAAGFEADGIEPSRRGVEAARSRYGVALQHATIERADVAEHSVDAVTLWHVLEHVDDPGAALDRIAHWLRPGGVLLVGVPNLDSLQARVGGPRWFHLDAPRHRTHFTPGGLDALLRRHGFAPEATTHVLLEHNPFGMWQSLVSRLTPTPSFLYHLLKRNVRVSAADAALTLAALPLVPLAALVELAAGLARRGGTVAVLARRAY